MTFSLDSCFAEKRNRKERFFGQGEEKLSRRRLIHLDLVIVVAEGEASGELEHERLPVAEEVFSRSVKIGKVLAWGQFIVEEAILDAKLPEIGLHGHGRHVRN